MEIITSLDQFPQKDNVIATVGSFDGVHLGHRQLLKRLKDLAHERNGVSVVITFEPHPQTVLYPDNGFFRINSFEQKIELFRREEIDYLVVIPFTVSFAKVSSEEFIKDILIKKINPKVLIMGPNHNFGKNRQGTFNTAQSMCEAQEIEVILIQECFLSEMAVRSTQIRKAILDEDYPLAELLLGHSVYQKRNINHKK